MALDLGGLQVFLELNSARFLAGVEKAEKRLKRFSRQSERLGRTLSRNLTLPLSLAGAGMLRSAAQIESGMIGVQKTTGLATKDVDLLRDSLLEFGTEAGVATDSLLETAKVAGQLGLATEGGAKAIETFTKTFAKLEIASDKTIQGELGAQAFARFIKLSGESVEAAENIGSAFTDLGNKANVTEGQILEAATRIVSDTARFKLGAANVLGLTTAFLEAGISGERAGTALTKFFAALESAVLSGDETLKTFADTAGITGDAVADLFKTDPTKFLQLFVKGLARLRSEGKDTVAILDSIGLSGIRGGNSLQALAANLDNTTDRINIANTAFEENTALSKEAIAANVGFEKAIAKLGGAFKQLSVAVAESGLLENITDLILGFRNWIKELSKLDPATLKLITTIGLIVAAIGPLLIGLGLTIKAFIFMKGAAVALGGGLITLAALLGPAGLMYVGITALIIAFAVWVTRTDELVAAKERLIEVTDLLRKSEEGLTPAIQENIDKTLELALAALELAKARAISQEALGEFGFIGEESPAAVKIKEIQAEIDRLNNTIKETVKLSAANDRFADSFGKTALVVKEASEATDDFVKSSEDLATGLEAANKAGDEAVALFEARREEIERNVAATQEYIEQLEFEISLLGKTSTEIAVLTNLRNLNADATEDQKLRVAELTVELEKQRKAMEEAKKATEQWTKIIDNAVENMQRAFGDLVYDALFVDGIDSFRDFADTLLDIFKRMIAEMISAWLTSGLLGLLGGKGFGGFSIGGLTGAIGGGGGLGGLLGGATTSSGAGGAAVGGVAIAGAGGATVFPYASVTGTGVSSAIGGTAIGTATVGGVATAAGGAATVFPYVSATGTGVGGAIGGTAIGTGAGAAAAAPLAAIAAPLAAFVVALKLLGKGKSALEFLQENQGVKDYSKFIQGQRGVVGLDQADNFKSFLDQRGVSDRDVRTTDFEGLGSSFVSRTGKEGDPVVNVQKLYEEMERLKTLLPEIEESAKTTFETMNLGAGNLTTAMQDGVLTSAEQAKLGFIDLGEISADQFAKITSAVDGGKLSIDGLTGATKLTHSELGALGAIGVLSMQEIQNATGLTEKRVENLIAAARSAGDAFGSAANDARGLAKAISSIPSIPSGSRGRVSNFASGGSFQVQGNAGVDANLVAFRGTAGERVSVETPGTTQRQQVGPDMSELVGRMDRLISYLEAA